MNHLVLDWPGPFWVLQSFAALLGLILGSFYTVCVSRYLSGESIVTPRSHCTSCGHQLAWFENIPLASYLLLGGRCRSCRTRISLRYPALELASGLWALGLVTAFEPSPAFVLHLAVGGLLLVAAFIDFDSYLLPDVLTLPGAALAFLGATLVLGMPVQDSLVGALAGGGSFWLLQQSYKLVRGVEGLGSGDVKLMLLIGALLGWRALPVVVTVAALGGLLASVFYMRRGGKTLQTMIPFGPFLILGHMLYVLYGDRFWAWYLG